MALAWAKKLEESSKEEVQTYEHLRDTYTYLRSTKRLLASPQTGHKYWKIVEKIENIFKEEGFGKTAKLKEIVEQLKKEKIGPDVKYVDRKKQLDIQSSKTQESKEERKGKEYLKQGSRMTRAKNWQYRLKTAIEEAVHSGWYPMFGTYTVAPQRLKEWGCLTRDELWQKTPAWDRFVKKFKTEIADACGYGRRPAKWPKGKEFLKYWAVIEHGKSGDHPHVHVIWLAKNMPSNWKLDPNRNSTENFEKDIPAASALWAHGIQRRTMALFITGSWFNTHWDVPRESEEEPGTVGTAAQISGYISKYLTKGDTSKWRSGTWHRVKATNSLGIDRLISNLEEKEITVDLLETLASRPMKYADSMTMQSTTGCPLSLLREKSKKALWKKLHCLRTTQAKKYLKAAWTKPPNEFFTGYIQSVRDGLRPWTMTPSHRFSFYTLILEEIKSEVHCKTRLKTAIEWLCYNEKVIQTSPAYTLLKGT